MSNRPSKKARKRERREAERRGIPIERLRDVKDDPNVGRGRRRRTQGANDA